MAFVSDEVRAKVLELMEQNKVKQDVLADVYQHLLNCKALSVCPNCACALSEKSLKEPEYIHLVEVTYCANCDIVTKIRTYGPDALPGSFHHGGTKYNDYIGLLLPLLSAEYFLDDKFTKLKDVENLFLAKNNTLFNPRAIISRLSEMMP